MRTSLLYFSTLLWHSISATPNPQPLYGLLIITHIVCVGMYYDLLLGPALKDKICAKVMQFVDLPAGKTLANSKLDTRIWYLQQLSGYCFKIAPMLMLMLFSLASVLSAAIDELDNHVKDMEERIAEAAEGREEDIVVGQRAEAQL
ncbi:Aste57867_4099 [Aphanomyces stellatus]|uniref:Aste57867_4099 protein n=1 Tax=Aphanomyces stellatus TaxID=120398 RepID=A0A485KEX3_9STRA|nr:hypothetical protein As57867_004088 [Aphanomyces stellatus]VFT81232.1 Aste57867_4099 [Aphanomyces stellatus]